LYIRTSAFIALYAVFFISFKDYIIKNSITFITLVFVDGHSITPPVGTVEKYPSASLHSSLVIAAYKQVRLIPNDFVRLASGCF
jgi:hypothetical protein